MSAWEYYWLGVGLWAVVAAEVALPGHKLTAARAVLGTALLFAALFSVISIGVESDNHPRTEVTHASIAGS